MKHTVEVERDLLSGAGMTDVGRLAPGGTGITGQETIEVIGPAAPGKDMTIALDMEMNTEGEIPTLLILMPVPCHPDQTLIPMPAPYHPDQCIWIRMAIPEQRIPTKWLVKLIDIIYKCLFLTSI